MHLCTYVGMGEGVEVSSSATSEEYQGGHLFIECQSESESIEFKFVKKDIRIYPWGSEVDNFSYA